LFIRDWWDRRPGRSTAAGRGSTPLGPVPGAAVPRSTGGEGPAWRRPPPRGDARRAHPVPPPSRPAAGDRRLGPRVGPPVGWRQGAPATGGRRTEPPSGPHQRQAQPRAPRWQSPGRSRFSLVRPRAFDHRSTVKRGCDRPWLRAALAGRRPTAPAGGTWRVRDPRRPFRRHPLPLQRLVLLLVLHAGPPVRHRDLLSPRSVIPRFVQRKRVWYKGRRFHEEGTR
jgi:hypothetical protein